MILKNKKFKIPKQLSKLFEYIRNISGYIFLFQLLITLTLVIWYFSSNAVVRHDPKKIGNFVNEKVKNVIGFEIKNIDNYFYVYLKGFLNNLIPSDLEKLDLSLDQESVIKLEFQRKNRGSSNMDENLKNILSSYVNGSLTYNDEKFPIKLRVKGDRKIHFNDFSSTSFKIDMRKDFRLWGMEEFSIQKPIVRNYVYEFIYHKMNQELGNISLKYKPVDVSFNGTDRGVFIIEEGFSKELIERHGKRNGPIFTGVDETSGKYPQIYYQAYSESFWKQKNIGLLETGYSILNNMKINENFYSEFINWESWAKFFAVTDLMQTYHGALPRNLKIYYDPVIGKIEPISFDGHYGTADFSEFIILDYLKNDSSCLWICDQRKWFLRFLLNEKDKPRKEFIDLYLKYLKEITDENFIKAFIDKNRSEIKTFNEAFYKDFSKSDQIFWKGWVPYVYDDNYLINRSKQIQKKLTKFNFTEVLTNKIGQNLYIDPTINSIPYKILEDKKCGIKTMWLVLKSSVKLNENCEKITLESIDNKKMSFNIFENIKFYDKPPINFESFKNIQNVVNGISKDKVFTPKDQKIIINENVLVPKNISMNLVEGQEIIIANNSILFVMGDLKVSGKSNNPVKIAGSKIDPGSIICLENNTEIKYADIQNLKSPNIKGFELYAGFNIINSNVRISNLIITDFVGEDMLNLINSKTFMKNVNFENSFSDALDIDTGTIEFENISCKNIGNDCIDISNTKLVGSRLTSNNVQDKTLSLGEKSSAIIKNLEINNSEIGLAVKDASEALIDNAIFYNTKLPIVVFVKKKEYGAASLIAKNLNLKNSKDLFLVDNKSNLIINDKKFESNLTGSEIESQLYGNTFGKATVR